LINIHDPEEEKKETKVQNQNRNERRGILWWGRIMCGRVVSSIAELLNWFCLCGLIKSILARIFGCLYEAFRDKEE
jgi:hypothetical protein